MVTQVQHDLLRAPVWGVARVQRSCNASITRTGSARQRCGGERIWHVRRWRRGWRRLWDRPSHLHDSDRLPKVVSDNNERYRWRVALKNGVVWWKGAPASR